MDFCSGTLNANCDCESTTKPIIWYEDGDGDGFGNSEKWVSTCLEQEGYVLNGDDCNDNDAKAYPGAECMSTEVENCKGELDHNCYC